MTPTPFRRILFASREAFLPGFSGGAERSVDGLVRALRERGFDATVLAGLPRGGERKRHRFRRLLGANRRVATEDARAGYAVFRAIPRRIVEAMEERLARARPDLVVVWNREAAALAQAADRVGVPTLAWAHDATFAWGGPLPDATRVAAVSEFLAERARAVLGRPVALVRPVFDLDACRAPTHEGGTVLFLNPRVTKGMDLAVEVARRLAHRRFVFAGARWLAIGERDRLASALDGVRNVEVEPGVLDVRPLYARADVLLVPSRCEDACPRVVLEAQANGVPVVATRIGGIPEISGGAALLLDPADDAEAWAAAVERVLGDASLADDLRRRGLSNAARPDLSTDAVTSAFLRVAAEALSGGAGRVR